jgi:hypothetical protein
MPQLTNPPPRLANQRLAALYSAMAASWFVSWLLIAWCWQVTLIEVGELVRVIMGIGGSVALLLAVMRHRWRLDGWSSFVFGFFGLVPITLALMLLINRSIGPVEERVLPILAIASYPGSTDRYAVLVGEAFANEQERVLLLPRDPEVWYAAAMRIRLRHGLLGFAVVLDRKVEISKDHRLLPERRW